MKGAMLFILVLLTVFAIPLFANPTLVNTVGEALNNSINSQEVPFSDQELMDNNVPVLSVGLKKDIYSYDSDKGTAVNYDINNVNNSKPRGFSSAGFNNSKRGGNLQFASGH